METFERVIAVVMIPVMLLNVFGGIVSGVWLAFLGEWGSLGIGFLGLILGPLIISTGMAPGLIFSVPGMVLADRGYTRLGIGIGMITAIWTMIVIAVWCCVVLFVFAKRADSGSLIPHLMWAYGVAIGPLTFLAQKDGQSWQAAVSTVFAKLAVITTIIAILVTSIRLKDAFVIIAAFMLLGLAIQSFITWLVARERKALGIDF